MKQMLGLVVEDQTASRQILESSVKLAFPGIELQFVTNLREASDWIQAASADGRIERLALALVDLGLPDGCGTDLIKALHEKRPDVPCIVVTIYGDDAYLFDALAAGAGGYLLKGEDQSLFIETLKRINHGEPPLSPSIARRLLGHFQKQAPKKPEGEAELTARERETLTLLAGGLTVSEAAAKMGLSSQTVASYVKIIYQKLHVSNRAEATREAVRRGLV